MVILFCGLNCPLIEPGRPSVAHWKSLRLKLLIATAVMALTISVFLRVAQKMKTDGGAIFGTVLTMKRCSMRC